MIIITDLHKIRFGGITVAPSTNNSAKISYIMIPLITLKSFEQKGRKAHPRQQQ